MKIFKNNEILEDCILLNKSIMRLPFEEKDRKLILNHNILECYEDIKKNKKYSIVKQKSELKIICSDHFYDNWDDWMREVVWYGHRSGKYTCNVKNLISNKNILESEKSSNIIGNSYIV